MLRPVHLAIFLLMVVLVASLEGPPDAAQMEIEQSPDNVNDLEADASSWGYSRPWRYGWKSGGWGGWGGWRGGGWGGRGWYGRGGWW
ncbi:PREDICTED: neuropeptide-like protein 32 [Dufourea novaeangliae]|uniref:neuropeptide-like protein 32 n=1 Tax=Dufourea novaeangliae TaxID=178035 RepID=UPI0007679ED7|nr:PREDICTED: neuropeptide-like protein 32 [Dufourea novaeangliae]